jgi:hypothetical protein
MKVEKRNNRRDEIRTWWNWEGEKKKKKKKM